MTLFKQDVNKKIKHKKKLTKEEKQTLKQLKKDEAERQNHIKINERNLKKRNKKMKSNKNSSESYSTVDGYKYTLSYIETNGKFASFLKLDCKFGSNRNKSYGWFINLIPEVGRKGVEATLITKDKLMDEDTERKIVRNRANSVINNSQERGDTIISKDNEGDAKLGEFRAIDFKRAQIKTATQDSESIVDFEIYIKLTSDNADDIVEQIEDINNLLNEDSKGIQISSVAGEQQKLMENIFEPVKGNKNNFTLMTGDYSGNDHMVRKGLNDVKDAVPIGLLTESYTSGVATMSINRRFKDDLLIAAPTSNLIDDKHFEAKESAPSLWGQLIANDVMVHNHKVFHIILNDFHYEPDYEGWIHLGEDEEGVPEYIWNTRYKDRPKYICNPVVANEMAHYDMAQGGINPLEVFSSLEDSEEDTFRKTGQYFSANLKKNAYMIYLQSKRKLNATESRTLRSLLMNFYTKRDLWDSTAYENPYAARIINLRSETVPTMNNFIQDLMNNKIASKDSTEEDVNTSDSIFTIVDDTLESYREVFGTKTTLPKPSEINTLQNFYDLSGIDDKDVMESQFVNVFNYVSQATKKDDVIMIHGVDNVSLETLDELRDLLRKGKKKGVRMAYLFDRIGSGELKKEGSNFVERADVYNTNGYLYNNIERDFNITIFGTMTNEELEKYEKDSRQDLTEKLRDSLTDNRVRNQYHVRTGEEGAVSNKASTLVKSYFQI
ncbi:hypothetical protein [Staphylococcus succinus]|uniref:hypothetical protein n=1 Tax=Staphylococcus succinus TaxID=61015 RepID=UPI000E6829AA|nr:hypothetical protein [Staphylococcus succinus]RIN27712.1 hypothetical protein BU067_01515 [Staphylococcus succinus]